jgi:hypothetical protein
MNIEKPVVDGFDFHRDIEGLARGVGAAKSGH